MKITEIQILPIKPKGGIVAFASFVLDGIFYMGSIAIATRLNGGYRLIYPNKVVGERSIDIYHPIDRDAAYQIELTITKAYEELTGNINDY